MRKLLLMAICLTIMVSSIIYAAPKEDVTLRFMWWGSDVRHKATLAAIELYSQKNPKVRIEAEYGGYDDYYHKLLTQLAGGTAADILQIDPPWLPGLMAQGDFLIDLNNYKSIINLSGFDKQFLADSCIIDKELVALPTGLNSETYIANKDFLAKYGIKPDFNWTWDSLLETGTRIHKLDNNAYLMDAIQDHIIEILKAYVENQSGKPFIMNDYSLGFNKVMLTNAYSYLRKLYESGTLEPLEESYLTDAQAEENTGFIAGKVGISCNWASAYVLYPPHVKFDLRTMRPAFVKDAKNTGIVVRPSQVIGINSSCTHPKEAAKFLDWFFNDPEAATILGMSRGIPPTKVGRKVLTEKNLVDKNVVYAVSVGVKNAGLPENPVTYNIELVSTFKVIAQKLAFNKITPEEAADELICKFQVKLAELKNRK